MLITYEIRNPTAKRVDVSFFYDGQTKPESFSILDNPAGTFSLFGWKIPKAFEGKIFASIPEAVAFINSL